MNSNSLDNQRAETQEKFSLSKFPYQILEIVFNFVERLTSYVLAVSLFSTGVAGLVASLFALYYADAIDLTLSPELMLFLKIAITTLWVLNIIELGGLHRLGFSGVGSTVVTLNKLISTGENKKISENYGKDELRKIYDSLNNYPLFNAINLSTWIFVLVLIAFPVSIYLDGFKWSLIGLICTLGVIAIFIAICFCYILGEAITGKTREECKRMMAEKNISYSERSVFTVRIKLILFNSLFVVNLFLSNSLTYFNRDELQKVIHFSGLAVIISILIAHAIFKLIYNSLKQIENAAYDLMKGGTGQIYTRTLDVEFVNVAKGMNEAAKTILEYQHGLEEKVNERTKELNLALQELKEKDEIMDMELNFAADIQKGIIPSRLDPWNGLHFAAYYSPMGKVSGDYYDVFKFPNHCFVLLADVSGHGVPAALVTMMAKQAFSSIIEEHLSPDEIFRKVNTTLVERVTTSDYLSAFFLKIDSRNRIIYSNAAHPKAVHYVSSKNEFLLLDTEGMFVGSFLEANDHYENRETKLNAGDRFFLYTDGILEHKNMQGDEFGMDRFLNCLDKYKDESLEMQIQHTIRELRAHIGSAPIKDDISMIALELQPAWTKFIDIYNSGVKLLKKHNLDEALSVLQEAYKLIPSYISLNFQLALVNFHLGNYTKAEEMILKFLYERPKDKSGLQLAINIYSKLEKQQKVEQFLNILKEVAPEEVKSLA
ncbi:MAG: SpoIIE family protein phosphatase [Leptospiraceae bacterium]|nr:SpoIIE family protein phosphatase [Leptospiraceae bacterium]